MSGSLVGLVGGALAGELNRFLFSPQRSIGTIFPDVAVQELHRDELQITRHPVEKGAAMTDHAYKENPVCEMRIGFTDVGLVGALLGAGGPGYASRMYGKLITMQAARIPVDVNTGKRFYPNMLVRAVSTETGEGTEFSAIIVARLEQIQIAQTQTTTVPDKAAQATPATTAATSSTGDRQTVAPSAPSPSLLQRGATFLTGLGGSAPATPPPSLGAGQ